MLVLGIDPGTAITGYGLVEDRDPLEMVACGVITTPAGSPLPERLLAIHRQLSEVIRSYQPEAVAVEELFFSKNVRTAMSVGHARGVILLAAAQAGLPIYQYKPSEVKQAVAGYGAATKKQMQEMESRCRQAKSWRRLRSWRPIRPWPMLRPTPSPLLPARRHRLCGCSRRLRQARPQ